MAIARYDFEAMYQLAGKVKQGARDLETLIQTIDHTVEEMGSVWSDPAQQKFSQQWTEMSATLKKYAPVIEEYGTAVKNHADKVREDGERC